MLLKKIKFYTHKRKLLSKLKLVGENIIYDIKSPFLTSAEIEIGNNVFIGPRAYITAAVKIGNYIMFGPFPIITGCNHYLGVLGKSNLFSKGSKQGKYETNKY